MNKKIKIIWIGGSWCKTINTIIELWIPWVKFVWIDTDKVSLSNCSATYKIQIWTERTGCNINKWKEAALENENKIRTVLKETDVVIIIYWLCWWTGSWAWPIVAKIAKNIGIKTIGIVTKPFSFEFTDRPLRLSNFEEWLKNLKKDLENIILISNDDIVSDTKKQKTFKESFNLVDKEVYMYIKRILAQE